jgi:replication-associated recombination protein RarA
MTVAVGEGLKMARQDATNILNKLIEHSKNDVRRLINTIEDVVGIYKNTLLTLNTVNEYCSVTMKKDVDIDSYKATKNLLFNYKSINDCLRQYEIDKALLF